jgi:hypothetical protein
LAVVVVALTLPQMVLTVVQVVAAVHSLMVHIAVELQRNQGLVLEVLVKMVEVE